MTTENLTALLAQQVMRWAVAPDRFLVGNRRWLPRWRFQPTERLEDAFSLLDEAAPQEYTMGTDQNNTFWVQVRIAGVTGNARDTSKPRAITFAVARALQILPAAVD